MESNNYCDYCKHNGSVGNEWCDFCKHCRGYYDDEVEMNFEGIEVEPVRHAEWKRRKFSWDFDILQCTNCRYEYAEKDMLGNKVVYRYCPHCGARMDGEQE